MKHLNKFSALLIILTTLTISACKSEKDTRFNRFIQNFTSRNNAYFHAKDKLKTSVQSLAETHQDDFTEVIEVFPYGDATTGTSIQPAMDEVYKKASWVITERPLSKWIDDSYLLIGKSQFFKREFYAAIEMFQYVASKYKGQPIAFEAQIWIAKSQIQIEKYNEAEALLSLVRSTKGLPEELKGMLAATTGWVYIREHKYSSAIPQMLTALELSKNRQEKIRYRYILAQLYLEDEQYKQANAMFTKVIKMNPPYQFAFNAKISLAKAVNKNDKGGLKNAKTYLTRMLKDDKNVTYFDQIYFELGNIEKYNGNMAGALQNYELSANYAGSNENQRIKTFLALANTYFELPNYEKAQAYFDSTADVVKENHPDYDQIIKKRNVLSDLIDNLVTLNTNDSLLALSNMSEAELDALLKSKAQQMIEDAERRQLEEEAQRDFDQNNLGNNQQNQLPVNQVGSNGEWYFYNKSAVASGYNDFLQRWGKRPLIDNWRLSEKTKDANIKADESDLDSILSGGAGGDPVKEITKIFKEGIPKDTADINALNEENKEALRNIGYIYDNSLDDNNEAIKAFENLLSRYPGSKYEPEVLYYLHKLYSDQENTAKADKYKQDLLTKYPNSSYSKILNKEANDLLESGVDKEVITFYENSYRLYLKEDYQGVLSNCKIAALKYPGNALQPKFDYLKALAIGRTDNEVKFKQELEYIIKSYPNTEIAETAQKTLDIINKTDSDNNTTAEKEYYKFNADEQHFNIIFVPNGVNLNTFKAGLVDYNNEYHRLDGLEITTLILDENNQMVFIKPFNDKSIAERYKKELENKPDFFKTHKITNFTQVTISASNFKLLLADKDPDKYIAFYKKYYGTK